MKKVLIALTIGWATVLAGCYDTGDQSLLDSLLNEKEEAAVKAKQASEEIGRLKSKIKTLNVEHKVKLEAKDRAVEYATKRIRAAKNDLQRLEKRLRDEEAGRQRAQRETEHLKNIIEAAKDVAATAAVGGSKRADLGKKQETAMELTKGEKHKAEEGKNKPEGEEKERQKAAALAAKEEAAAKAAKKEAAAKAAKKEAAAKAARKRAAAKAAQKKKEAIETRKRTAARTAKNARRRKAAAERTRRLDEEYRRREAERLASSRGRPRRKIEKDSLSDLGR